MELGDPGKKKDGHKEASRRRRKKRGHSSSGRLRSAKEVPLDALGRSIKGQKAGSREGEISPSTRRLCWLFGGGQRSQLEKGESWPSETTSWEKSLDLVPIGMPSSDPL